MSNMHNLNTLARLCFCVDKGHKALCPLSVSLTYNPLRQPRDLLQATPQVCSSAHRLQTSGTRRNAGSSLSMGTCSRMSHVATFVGSTRRTSPQGRTSAAARTAGRSTPSAGWPCRPR